MGRYSMIDESSCTLTTDERREEANRLCTIIIENGMDLNQKENDFVSSIHDVSRNVSVKQLFWLRDIASKYI